MPPKPRRPKKPKAEGETGPTVEELLKREEDKNVEMERIKEQRNYFQLERDKIATLLEVSRQDSSDRAAALRAKDRELEEIEEKHRVEIKVYKQKVKHLLYEHQNNITVYRAEAETTLKLHHDTHTDEEAQLLKDKRALKVELKEAELSHTDAINALNLEHDKQVTKLREEFERLIIEAEARYDHRLKAQRDDLDLRRKTEIHEVEERKNRHIKELLDKHELAFGEIKNYYNDITINNLELIKSLKEQVEELKKKELATEKLMHEVAQENKRLADPLQTALQEVTDLKHKLSSYEKDKMTLAHTKARNKALEEANLGLEWEHEVSLQRFAKVEAERDDLYNKFEEAVLNVRQKTGLKTALLEKKAAALSEDLEKKEAHLEEVLAAANLDPQALGQVTTKLDGILAAKNAQIRDLTYEVHKATKQHNDAVRTFEAKLTEFGIPLSEVAFNPLPSVTTTGPAGLVA
eukprot:TRINITY_DN41216_c0_g1_i2.p1 TRINITY_DN41216_c0_g1~~TRINITY_DN41216_c0_g1_i2.p1  ORF type:complete len:464 (+),score=138.04 TRINITY_DN41216_c0_g1_i2:70-1461(+)